MTVYLAGAGLILIGGLLATRGMPDDHRKDIRFWVMASAAAWVLLALSTLWAE